MIECTIRLLSSIIIITIAIVLIITTTIVAIIDHLRCDLLRQTAVTALYLHVSKAIFRLQEERWIALHSVFAHGG